MLKTTNNDYRLQTQYCRGCGSALSKVNQSGYCRKCFASYSGHARTGRSTDSEVMRRVSLARLAWCPIDLLPDYRRMTRIQGVRAAEARKIIQQHMSVQVGRHYAGFAT